MGIDMTKGVVGGDSYEEVRTATDEVLLRSLAGAVQVAEYVSADRDGPPPHRHTWDEVEYVIEGEVEFWLDDEWHRVGPGGVQTLPAGTPHSVRVPEGTARVLMVTIGAPYDGFARDLAALPPNASGSEVVAATARHGVTLA